MNWIEVQGELHGGNSEGGGRRRARYGRRLIANCSAKLSFVVTLSEMSLRHCHLVIIYRGPPMIDTFVNCRVDIIHPPSQIMTSAGFAVSSRVPFTQTSDHSSFN